MKISPPKWLASRASPPGMLACGVRNPAGEVASHTTEAGWPAEAMEAILSQFDSMRVDLFSDQFAPRWSTWAFEQGQLRYVARPDGWLLGLVVRSDSEALARLDSLSVEFLSLQLES